MSRPYRGKRAKIHRVYDIHEVMALFGVSRNTVTNWMASGLRPVDDHIPKLFPGRELCRFHDARTLRKGRKLEPSEFNCFACRTIVSPDPVCIQFEAQTHSKTWLTATCPECGKRIHKILNETTCDALREGGIHNHGPHFRDEEKDAVQAQIVNPAGSRSPAFNPLNERVVHDYQTYLNRYSAKTADQHLAAIRGFEAATHHKDFSKLKTTDVDAYRRALIDRSAQTISKSTAQHHASFLKTFLQWLCKQREGKGLDGSLPDYIDLPTAQMARAREPAPRAVPTLDDVERLMDACPANSLLQRRNRAIIAASLLFGTRADTTASLRFGSINRQAKTVDQDGTQVRTKNGKSVITTWFPVSDLALRIIVEWMSELEALGIRSDDALFPPDTWLDNACRINQSSRSTIEPWQTAASVRSAFIKSCAHAGLAYVNPHSIRHCLASLQEDYCRTAEERKAWSMNLSHSSTVTTENHYRKMTPQQARQVMGRLIETDRLGNADLHLLLAYHEHLLMPGTPEYKRAAALALKRQQARIVTAAE